MYYNRSNYRHKKSSGLCPRCYSDTILCQNRFTGGWFTSCKKCAYTGPPETYFGEIVDFRR